MTHVRDAARQACSISVQAEKERMKQTLVRVAGEQP